MLDLSFSKISPSFCMLIGSMRHTLNPRTRNIHSTEVKLIKGKNIVISFPTCIVCLSTPCNSIGKYCTCDRELKIIYKK
jgi:hypothetical protein